MMLSSKPSLLNRHKHRQELKPRALAPAFSVALPQWSHQQFGSCFSQHQLISHTPAHSKQMTKTAAAAQQAAQQTKLSSTERWEQILQDIRENTVVYPPAKANQDTQPDAASCLLVVFPGGAMKASNYKAFSEATVAAAAEYQGNGLHTWIAVPQVDLLQVYLMAMSMLEEGVEQQAPAPPMPGSAPPPIDYSKPPTDPITLLQRLVDVSIDSAVDAAKKLGVKAKLDVVRTPSGRYSNVVIAGHSAAGCVLGDVAFRTAAATIQLESYWSDQGGQTLARPAGWAASTRPILVLAGGLDGQMTWAAQLQEAVISAWVASRQGAAYAAAFKPFIVIPDLNHAQMCGMPSMAHRGDVAEIVPAEQVLAEAARVVTAFIALHFTPQPKEAKFDLSKSTPTSALHLLKDQALHTAHFYEPYAAAMGAGSLTDAWTAGDALDKGQLSQPIPTKPPFAISPNIGVPMDNGSVYGAAKTTSQGQPLNLIQQLSYTGPISFGMPIVQHWALQAAEQEVAQLQMYMAQQAVDAGLLPAEVLSKLRIVVNLHHTLDGLLYSQPMLRLTPSGVVEMQVQAYMHWPALERGKMNGQLEPIGFSCASHTLWLKTKGPSAIALETRDLLGMEALPLEKCDGVSVQARTLNQQALDWALAAVPENIRKRYYEKGVPLEFIDDQQLPSPAVWVRGARMRFSLQSTQKDVASAAKVMTVQSPVVDNGLKLGPTAMACPPTMEERRFWGGLYIKVMSRAQAVEWVMLGAIRQRGLPDTAPCRWGGSELQ